MAVDNKVTKKKRLLLIDDVITEGTTLDCVFRRVREIHPDAEVAATTAGQMIVKAVIKDEKTVCS